MISGDLEVPRGGARSGEEVGEVAAHDCVSVKPQRALHRRQQVREIEADKVLPRTEVARVADAFALPAARLRLHRGSGRVVLVRGEEPRKPAPHRRLRTHTSGRVSWACGGRVVGGGGVSRRRRVVRGSGDRRPSEETSVSQASRKRLGSVAAPSQSRPRADGASRPRGADAGRGWRRGSGAGRAPPAGRPSSSSGARAAASTTGSTPRQR